MSIEIKKYGKAIILKNDLPKARIGNNGQIYNNFGINIGTYLDNHFCTDKQGIKKTLEDLLKLL